jgi:hypothetical protein
MDTRQNAICNAIVWGIIGLVLGAAIGGLKGAVGIGIGAATVAYCMPPTASGSGDWAHIRYIPWSNTFYLAVLFLGFMIGLSVGREPFQDALTGVVGMALVYPMSYWIQTKPW